MKTKRKFKFSNGDKVEESVTGFEGTITGTCYYITGCNQYLVVAKAKDSMSTAKSTWYDEGRLKLIKSKAVKASDVKGDENGCDIAAPNKG